MSEEVEQATAAPGEKRTLSHPNQAIVTVTCTSGRSETIFLTSFEQVLTRRGNATEWLIRGELDA